MTFIQAAHHSSGSNLPPTRVVIHATCPDIGYPRASAAGQARATARYFQSESAGGSAHYVCDIAETIQCLPDDVIAWHAPPNAHSIGIEICAEGGSAGSYTRHPEHRYTRSQWESDQVWPAVVRAAELTRELCRRHGIPLTRLSAADVRAGRKGICGHVDVSNAFGLSDHDDPGPDFPWNEFIAAVQGKTTNKGELSMSDVNTLTKLIKASNDQLHHDIGVVQTQNGTLKSKIDNLSWVKNPVTGKKWSTKDALWSVWYYVLECRNRIQTIENRISDLEKKVK